MSKEESVEMEGRPQARVVTEPTPISDEEMQLILEMTSAPKEVCGFMADEAARVIPVPRSTRYATMVVVPMSMAMPLP